MRKAPGRRVLAGAIGLVVVFSACGSGAPSGGSGALAGNVAPSSAPSAASAALAPEVLAAIEEPSLQRLADAGEALDAAIDEETGLVDLIGANIVGWLTDQRSAIVRAALDDAGVEVAGVAPTAFSSELLAAAGPRTAFGEAWAGATLLTPLMLEFASANVGSSLDVPVEPRTSRTERTDGNLHTVATTSMSLTLRVSGSTVISEADVSQESTTDDTRFGTVIAASAHRAHIRAELTVCPDASGVVVMKVEIELTSETGGALGRVAFQAHSAGERRGTVGEDAFLQSESETLEMDFGTTSSDGTSRTGSATRTIVTANGPNGRFGRVVEATATSGNGSMTAEESTRWQNALHVTNELVSSRAFAKAQELWRGGKCVKIVATESSRLVDIGERVPFTAQPVHVIDGGNLDKPVVATLRGNASVDPADSEQDAPAAILYTAPGVPDDGGIVTLKSTSNRGIGTLTIEFKTRPPTFQIDEPSGGGRIRGLKCDGIGGEWVVDGTYDRLGFKGQQKWVIVIDEATMRGTFTYTDKQVGSPGGVAVEMTGNAKGEAILTIDDANVATFQLRETVHTFTAKTPNGGKGSDNNAPLASSTLVWQPNAPCP